MMWPGGMPTFSWTCSMTIVKTPGTPDSAGWLGPEAPAVPDAALAGRGLQRGPMSAFGGKTGSERFLQVDSADSQDDPAAGHDGNGGGGRTARPAPSPRACNPEPPNHGPHRRRTPPDQQKERPTLPRANLCLGWPDRSRDVSPYFLGHPDRIGPKGVVTMLVEIA